jgi:hypothetical protein
MPAEIPAKNGFGAAPSPVEPLHLLKMAVGIGSLDELRRLRAARIKEHGGSWIYTRNHPRRTEAVLAGGSIYWVIRGQIRVRQHVTGFDSKRDDKGRAYCLIMVAPELVATLSRPWRAFQGWRYLTAADAPPDLADTSGTPGGAADALPDRLVAELRALGLW